MTCKLLCSVVVLLFIASSIGATATKIDNESDEVSFCDCENELIETTQTTKYSMGLILDDNPPEPAITYTASTDPLESWNWRSASYRGKQGDWITGIRDQEECGSCYAFAAIASLESALNIAEKNPSYDKDYSEQYIVSCGPSTEFSSGIKGCNGGQRDDTLGFTEKYGAIPESKYPYTSGDGITPSCSAKVQGWKSTKLNVRGWNSVSGTNAMKNALVQYGPLMAGMKVYDDFLDYKSGAYEHKSGEYLGLHAVILVGYNDEGGYWICKNSWGTGWGENGWFKIKYGECDIDTYTCYYYSHLGNDPLTYGRLFYDISGEWRRYDDVSIQMSKDQGSCNAYYTFDIGVSSVKDSMKIGIEFIEWGAYILSSGPNLYLWDYNKGEWVLKWEGVCGPLNHPQSYTWFEKTISGDSNRYIKKGIVKLRIYAHENTNTVLRSLRLKYDVNSPAAEPEVYASGDIKLEKVKPGSTHTDTITVKNVGDSSSSLSWLIQRPSFGSWRFDPNRGDLSGSDSGETIDVTLTVPDEKNWNKKGTIKIYNEHDKTDYRLITVEVSTAQGKSKNLLFFSNYISVLRNHFLNIFNSFKF
jgi:hypothetical protein